MKRLNTLLSVVLALIVCFSVSCSAEQENAVSTPFLVGDIITFGVYEQDGNPDNGKEPIEWIILDKNEDGEYLLFSRYILENMQYYFCSAMRKQICIWM